MMTRALRPSPASSSGLARLSRPGQRPFPICRSPAGPSSREGALPAPAGLLRGAAQLVRAAPVAAHGPKWVPSPQNGQSWGPTGSSLPEGAPGTRQDVVRRPHPGAGHWTVGPASLRLCSWRRECVPALFTVGGGWRRTRRSEAQPGVRVRPARV